MLSLKKLSKEESSQPRVLYPEEILFKKESEAKTYSGKQKRGEFFINKLELNIFKR